MKLIDSEVLLFETKDPLIKIELIGRICYKSSSAYTRETAVQFIKSLIKRGHLSVLEHAVFLFEGVCLKGPFIRHTYHYNSSQVRKLTSCNLRAIIEQNNLVLQKALIEKYPELEEVFGYPDLSGVVEKCRVCELNQFEDITMDEVKAHLHTTFSFTTDRGVTHEMVRHRIASYTQESTRYCNYSNDKFGRELQFVRPATFDEWTAMQKLTYMQSLEAAEKNYMSLVDNGLPPQFARGVLPTDVRTTIVMTANHEEWEHFFDLRSRGVTGAPHPNMKKVASRAEELYYKEYNNFENIN